MVISSLSVLKKTSSDCISDRETVLQTHFYTMKKVLGRERAIGLSLFGLIPYFEPWLLKFVQLWRTSNILGQELIVDYVSRYIPGPERSRFYKSASFLL